MKYTNIVKNRRATVTRYNHQVADRIDDLASGIVGTFTWRDTPQGVSYWADVFRNLQGLAESRRQVA